MLLPFNCHLNRHWVTNGSLYHHFFLLYRWIFISLICATVQFLHAVFPLPPLTTHFRFPSHSVSYTLLQCALTWNIQVKRWLLIHNCMCPHTKVIKIQQLLSVHSTLQCHETCRSHLLHLCCSSLHNVLPLVSCVQLSAHVLFPHCPSHCTIINVE